MDRSTETQQELETSVPNHEVNSTSATNGPEGRGDNSDQMSQEVQKDENGNPAFLQFSKQLTNILADVENKIKAESSNLNASLSANMTIAFEKERDQHAREKTELQREMKSLYRLVDSLESKLDKEATLNKKLVLKIQSQRNLLNCSKIFGSWKLFAQNRKHEEFKTQLADRRYELSLKRKVFQWWLAQVKARWKNRLDLQAHMNVIEMQKRITNLYETKIRDLEDNLSEAGKTIDCLQSQQVMPSDVLSYLPSSHSSNLTAPIYQKDLLNCGATAASKVPSKTASPESTVCPECVMEQKGSSMSCTSLPMRYPSMTVPSTLLKDVPVPRAVPQPASMYHVASASFPNLCRKETVDHMPKGGRFITHQPHPSACAKPASRPQSSRTYREKKVV